MHASASKSLVFLLALILAGCKNEGDGDQGPNSEAADALAATYCHLLETCNCAESPFDSTGMCVAETTTLVEDSIAAGEAAGLTFNPECMDILLSLVADVGCKTETEHLADPDFVDTTIAACKLLSGTATEGEACTFVKDPYVYGDSCMQGLMCPWKTCVSALPGEGESCMNTGRCEAGFGCDLNDFICKGPVGPGEACDNFSLVCQDGYFCSAPDKVCVPLLMEGEPCSADRECAAGLECEAPADGGPVCVPEGPMLCP